MATRKVIVETPCSRCPGKSVEEISPDDIKDFEKKPSSPPDIVVLCQGQEIVRYDYLCPACTKSVDNYLQQVVHRPGKKSGERHRTTKDPAITS